VHQRTPIAVTSGQNQSSAGPSTKMLTRTFAQLNVLSTRDELAVRGQVDPPTGRFQADGSSAA
jgi:hypothetical protein